MITSDTSSFSSSACQPPPPVPPSSSQSNQPRKITVNPYAKRGRPPPTSWKRSRSSPTLPDETTNATIPQQQQQHSNNNNNNNISEEESHQHPQRNDSAVANRSSQQQQPSSSPPPPPQPQIIVHDDPHQNITATKSVFPPIHNPYARRKLNTSHSEDANRTASNPSTSSSTQYSFTQADIVQETNNIYHSDARDRIVTSIPSSSVSSTGQYSFTQKEIIQNNQRSSADVPSSSPSIDPDAPIHNHRTARRPTPSSVSSSCNAAKGASSPYSLNRREIIQDRPSVTATAAASSHQQQQSTTFRNNNVAVTPPQQRPPQPKSPNRRPQAPSTREAPPAESSSSRFTQYDRPHPSSSSSSAPPPPLPRMPTSAATAPPPPPASSSPNYHHVPPPHSYSKQPVDDQLPRPPHWKYDHHHSHTMMNRPPSTATTTTASTSQFNSSNNNHRTAAASTSSPRRPFGGSSSVPSSPAKSVGSPSSYASSRSNNTTFQTNHNNTTTSIDPRQEGIPPTLQFDPQLVQPISDEYRRPLIAHANLNQPLLNGWNLFSHQKQAILFGLKQRRAILALDMGTGKTIIGCVWAKAFYKVFQCHIIVLCPVSLKTQWQRTAQEATGLTICMDGSSAITAPKKRGTKKTTTATASSPSSTTTDHDVGDTNGVVTIASWAKIPTQPPIFHPHQKYVVLADEAHSMQSMTAARTREALKLMQHSNCVGVLLLTGTPLKNGKPLNLYPLLKAVHHPLSRDQRQYESHFCQGHYQHYGNHQPAIWKADGATNLLQLQQLTSSHILYLSKEQVLKELPLQQRIIHKVPVSHQRQLQHTKALQELAALYHSSSSNTMGGGSGNSDAILGAIQRVRLVSSLAKMDAAVKLAQSVLKTEPAIVIFSSFVEVCKSIRQQLAQAGWEGELLTGETPPAKRQDMVDRFQTGLSPVFVGTFGAGGVGLTLTAARTVLLVDRPWTPGEANQAEDRVRRIGQTKPVQSLWISAFDLDDQIDAILEQKQQTASAVLQQQQQGGGKLSNVPTGPSKLSIHQLLQRILPPRPNTATTAPGSGNLKQTSMLNFTQSIPDD